MKRLFRLTGLLLALVVLTTPAAADKAKSLWNKGRDAEARQDYAAAYEFYKQAYDLKPKELRYRTSYNRLRFLGAVAHVHRGQKLRDDGKLQDALAEFERAYAIDPSLFLAQQEIKRTRALIEGGQEGQPPTPPLSSLGKRLEQAGGPVELAPISDVPITLNITEDPKVIYSTVGKLAGINVLFDPDLSQASRGGRVHIELNGVTLNEALGIIALESKTFWRPVTPNTIFVAQDTKSKRQELEQNVLKTFYLSNINKTADLQEVRNVLATLLDLNRAVLLNSQSAIVVRGTPDQVALAEKVISDVDKAKPEVVVDVAVLQVSRDLSRRLGISPPTGFSIALQPNATTTTTTTNTTNPTTTTGTTSGNLTLNKLGNLNANDFVVSIPQASAQLLFSDANSKLIQNPQIRGVDGEKASLKIGDRVPIASGSFQPGIGGVGINPLVNTQFTYIDVGVNIGGIEQPIIGQRKIEHDIRLREGEVNVLGGIFEESEQRSLSGLPWVSQVPVLKYFFAQESKDRRENEIVFVLTPRIVRTAEITEANLRALDVGTFNQIDLRRGARNSTPAPGQPPTPQAGTRTPRIAPQPASQPQAVAQVPTTPTQAVPAPAPGPATLAFDPPNIAATVGSTFSVNVVVNGGQSIHSVPLQLTYDPKVLQFVEAANGDLLSRDGQAVMLVHRPDESTGTLQLNATRPPGAPGVAGGGTVYTLKFLAKTAGQSGLAITRANLRDPGMQNIPATGGQAIVTVR